MHTNTTNELVIQTNALSKSFGTVQALDRLDLAVPKYTIFGFLGPNGAGKSTTIKLLLGLTRPSAGSGTVFGLDVVRDSTEIRKRVGVQSAAAYGLLSLRAGAWLSPGPCVLAVLGLALHTCFYLVLTVLLGVWSQSRGAVLGGALGCLLGGSILSSLVHPLAVLPPWSMSGLLPALAAGQTEPIALVGSSMAGMAVLIAVCVTLSIVKFGRIEF